MEGRSLHPSPSTPAESTLTRSVIPVHEAANLEFRADIYNVLNHTNFSSVGTTLGASTFGKVLSAHDPGWLSSR